MRWAARRRGVLAGLAIGGALLAAACGGLIQGDPSKLVLAAGQMPAGFHVLAQGKYANADVAKAFGIAVSQVSGSMGRLTGYHSTFVRTVTAADFAQGPVRIDSVVSLYQGAVPAGNALAYEIKVNRQRIANLKTLSLGSVGQQSFCFAYTQVSTQVNTQAKTQAKAQASVTMRFVDVYWRDRNVIAAVAVAGVQGAFADSEAMRLARAQDALLKKAS